jgi:hypothetical protein
LFLIILLGKRGRRKAGRERRESENSLFSSLDRRERKREGGTQKRRERIWR